MAAVRGDRYLIAEAAAQCSDKRLLAGLRQLRPVILIERNADAPVVAHGRTIATRRVTRTITREQIRAQIWGPWMFTPGTGPDEARADSTGRVTEYREQLVVGEELSFQLDPTMRPAWRTSTTQEVWQWERDGAAAGELTPGTLSTGSGRWSVRSTPATASR
jgi:hypothetical protein